MSETCSIASRRTVQKGVKDDLRQRIAAHTREWPMGDRLDPATRVGPLVAKAHFDKVASCRGADATDEPVA